MVCRHYGLQPYMCKLCDKTFSEPSAAHKHVKTTHKKADRSLVMVNNPDWSQLQVTVPDNLFYIGSLPFYICSLQYCLSRYLDLLGPDPLVRGTGSGSGSFKQKL
jgi:hypothetical protein